MNEYTTSAINKRRLQVNIDKCVRIHISDKGNKQTSDCEKLLVDKWNVETFSSGSKLKLADKYKGKVHIKTVQSHLYLGDTVASDASNSLNIKSRVSKGHAVIKNIVDILEETHFGDHYFEAMRLLRESMFLSVITNNLEVSFNLTNRDIKDLEVLDQQLIRRCTMTSSKSSRILTLLELGITSVRVEIQRKRVLYYHHLLTSEESLAKDILHAQINFPMHNDWIHTVNSDLKELDINLTPHEISVFSKTGFKKYLKEACLKSHFKHLIKEKKKLSKGSRLDYDKLEIQNYLKSGNGLSVHTMRTILQTRIRDLPLKCNFRNAFIDTKCLAPGCKGEDETKHIFECQYLGQSHEVTQNLVSFEDIYCCNVKKQSDVINVLKVRLQQRSKFVAPQNKTWGPGGPGKGKKISLVTREAKYKQYHKQITNTNN